MKKFVVSMVCALFVVSLLGCAAQPSSVTAPESIQPTEDQSKVASSQESSSSQVEKTSFHNIKFYCAPEYTSKEAEKSFTLSFEDTLASITITSTSLEDTLDTLDETQATELMLDSVLAALGSGVKAGDKYDVSVAGLSAKAIECDVTIQGVSLKYIPTAFVYNNECYIVAYSEKQSSDLSKSYLDEYGSFLESIELIPV